VVTSQGYYIAVLLADFSVDSIAYYDSGMVEVERQHCEFSIRTGSYRDTGFFIVQTYIHIMMVHRT
jgi:hypothetical protein